MEWLKNERDSLIIETCKCGQVLQFYPGHFFYEREQKMHQNCEKSEGITFEIPSYLIKDKESGKLILK